VAASVAEQNSADHRVALLRLVRRDSQRRTELSGARVGEAGALSSARVPRRSALARKCPYGNKARPGMAEARAA
jgi:hypothetical protein